jgi:hypothetical protein
MPESIHPPSNPESAEPTRDQRFPSEQELRDFELVQSRLPIIGYSIEEIAQDPVNPTDEELQMLQALNRPLAGEKPTFEDWFGYPDPREPENRDDQHVPGSQDQ